MSKNTEAMQEATSVMEDAAGMIKVSSLFRGPSFDKALGIVMNVSKKSQQTIIQSLIKRIGRLQAQSPDKELAVQMNSHGNDFEIVALESLGEDETLLPDTQSGEEILVG